MREALEKAKARFDELTTQLSDPAVVSVPAELKRISKERSGLEALVDAARRYDDVLRRIAEDTAIVRNEKDAELVAMAKSELEELEQARAGLEAELPKLLLPPDPLDHKNVIVEIRAGTGGDEAALFASEILRMYTKYAERHNWRTEVLSTSASSGIGGVKEVVVLDRRAGSLQPLQVRERRPPRAARPRDRGERPDPHLRRSRSPSFPRPRTSTWRSSRRTCRSTSSAPRARAGRA